MPDLLRILGVAFGVAVVIGGTIGSGILRTPGAVVAQFGSERLALAAWATGAVYALLAASALADLVTSVPRSGGFYVFARRALGNAVGVAIGWADWASNCAAVTYAAITFSEYMALLYPGMAAFGNAPGAAVVVVFTALQFGGMRLSGRVQEVTSFGKALAFVLLIALLFMAPAASADATALPGPAGGFATFAAAIIALQLVVGAFDGWQQAMYFAGEDTNPSRNLPRSLIGGVGLVAGVYLLINVAFMRVLPTTTLAASSLPAADAATVVFGASGTRIVTWLAALSLLPLIHAVLMSASRVLYAMGRDGLLPSRVGHVSPSGTPTVALVASAAVGLLLLGVQTFDLISAVMAFFAVTGYTGAFVALLVLRRREPGLERPFRSWGYPWTTLVVLAGALALLGGLVVSAPIASAVAIAVLALSYPVALATSARRA
ncbi:MAG: APC family permease [Vicinamibacterales bacterium]